MTCESCETVKKEETVLGSPLYEWLYLVPDFHKSVFLEGQDAGVLPIYNRVKLDQVLVADFFNSVNAVQQSGYFEVVVSHQVFNLYEGLLIFFHGVPFIGGSHYSPCDSREKRRGRVRASALD